MTSLKFRLWTVTAVAAFLFYVLWNIYWLSMGQVPPSILIGVFGIPAPTTGMTRSTLALVDGRWLDSLAFNPFTIPTILLWAYSLMKGAKWVLRRPDAQLAPVVVKAWAWVLGLAWIYKLTQHFCW